MHKLFNIFSPNQPMKSLVLALFLILSFVLGCGGLTGRKTEENKNGKKEEKKRPTGEHKKTEDEPKKPEGKSEIQDKGDFKAVYSDVQDQSFKDFNQRMKDQKVIEGIANDLNKSLALPMDVTLTFKDCGFINAFYMPSEKSITICYELMVDSYNSFLKMGYKEDEANERMFGATTFFFLHELGHCLIDVYQLPAVGREEDSVDQLSTYILIEEMGGDNGESAAINGALIFKAWAENADPERLYADEHSFGMVRYFNVICWLYGANQQKYQQLVANGVLPEERAVRCPDEYQKLSTSWKKLTQPYRKD